MAVVGIYKVVSALPGTLDANALYLVRVGTGFDIYMADSTGTAAYALNNTNPNPPITVSDTAPSSPSTGDIWIDTGA